MNGLEDKTRSGRLSYFEGSRTIDPKIVDMIYRGGNSV